MTLIKRYPPSLNKVCNKIKTKLSVSQQRNYTETKLKTDVNTKHNEFVAAMLSIPILAAGLDLIFCKGKHLDTILKKTEAKDSKSEQKSEPTVQDKAPVDSIKVQTPKISEELTQKINSSLQKYSMEQFSGLINEKESQRLFNAITENATPEIAEKRLSSLTSQYNRWFDGIASGCYKNGSFILDNMDLFDKAFSLKNTRLIGPDIFKIIGLVNSKETLEALSRYADNPTVFKTKALKLFYDSKPHNIAYGTEKVKVDSADIVYLLTGYNRRTYEEFNQIVERLTEASMRNNGDLNYYKIAEGLIRQKPELAQISKDYDAFIQTIKHLDEDTFWQKEKAFFEQLDEEGRLPKQIEFNTIVPDQNALIHPMDTLELLSQEFMAV